MFLLITAHVTIDVMGVQVLETLIAQPVAPIQNADQMVDVSDRKIGQDQIVQRLQVNAHLYAKVVMDLQIKTVIIAQRMQLMRMIEHVFVNLDGWEKDVPPV